MRVFLIFALASCSHAIAQENQAEEQQANGQPVVDELLQRAATRLVEMQEEDGAWPYEGVYRVRRRIPFGYRVGGTAIVCTSLLYAGQDDARTKAIVRGAEIILKDLEHKRMEADTSASYDVRIWGHIYALDLFCRLRASGRFEELRKRTDPWIPKLVEILKTEQISDGGWNYANNRGRRHASFVTAPAVQALLLAKEQGEDIPDAVFLRARKVLRASRTSAGAFQYSGTSTRQPAPLPGSIARSAVCESTLILLGDGNVDHLRGAIDAFHKHWNELEKRRKKTGTHERPYGVAPYYFYYGHRYLAQAIQFLPKDEQAQQYKKFKAVLMRTKDPDDTWNDRVFDRSKAFGTAMSILALMNNVPVPRTFDSQRSEKANLPK